MLRNRKNSKQNQAQTETRPARERKDVFAYHLTDGIEEPNDAAERRSEAAFQKLEQEAGRITVRSEVMGVTGTAEEVDIVRRQWARDIVKEETGLAHGERSEWQQVDQVHDQLRQLDGLPPKHFNPNDY